MHRVFVYGTLKRGFCRHPALSAQKFLGIATSTPGYRLFDLGSYPGMIVANNGNSIEGELYEVDDTPVWPNWTSSKALIRVFTAANRFNCLLLGTTNLR